MEVIFEFIFTVVGEIIIQLFGERLVELGVRAVAETIENPRRQNPWLAGCGYIVLGLFAGWVSLLLMKQGLFHSQVLRFANVIITPLVSGLVMALIGYWRRKHDQDTIRLESFFYGYLFALSMALVRYFYTT